MGKLWTFIACVVMLSGCSTKVYASQCYNDCSGHGSCNDATEKCTCYEGWGAATDIAIYKAPDCSLRVCPAGAAWVDTATSATSAHALAECSNAGICNRYSGQCNCFRGYSGDACQRSTCPNDCSGHGRCVSMRVMATDTTAQPISAATTYDGAETTTTWDQDKIYGCVCDSGWTVGLASGETQVPEWFGPDCSRKHCPTGDDPDTTVDETDCGPTSSAATKGSTGNLCHVDCSNRGICDYQSGICDCFTGFYGANCGLSSVLAT